MDFDRQLASEDVSLLQFFVYLMWCSVAQQTKCLLIFRIHKLFFSPVFTWCSWQLDPCFCYQIEKDAKKLQSLQTLDLSTSDPVVLVLSNNRLRQYLQLTVVLSTSAYCGWKIYESYFG